MGAQEKKKVKNKNKKLEIIITVVAAILVFFPISEVAYKYGLLSFSVTDNIFNTFNLDAVNEKDDFIEFVDLGQADSTIIKSGVKVAVIDFGLPDDENKLYWHLKEIGVNCIDLAVVTHHHKDHIGGLIKILKTMTVKNLLISITSAEDADKGYFNEVMRLAYQKGVNIINPKINTTFTFDDKVLSVVYVNDTDVKENNRSIILSLKQRERKILFMGDAEQRIEKELLYGGYDIKTDIIKLGHHGSYTSSNYDFLKATGAKHAIISSGYNNYYNHPHDSVIDDLNALKITVFRTDLDGSVKCFLNEKDINIQIERLKEY